MTATRRIFITGATGGLGRRLVADRLARGDSIVVLSRRPDEARRRFAAVANPRVEVVEGDPAIPGRWQRLVGACDAVVHLAGEPIAKRRWNPEVREAIRRSRVEGTYQIAFACRTAAKPPAVLLSASGIGFLPRDRSGPLDESSPPGRGFLAQVALAWEREALRARSDSTRVVTLRIPIVLDAESGFLHEIVPWWKRGIDPTPWSAHDRVPWLHWQDFLEVVDRALRDDRLKGPVHAVAPEASEAASWRRAIAAALGRGALRVPPILARLAAGGVIDSMRGSCEAVAAKLESVGFAWRHRELQEAIAAEIASFAPRERIDAHSKPAAGTVEPVRSKPPTVELAAAPKEPRERRSEVATPRAIPSASPPPIATPAISTTAPTPASNQAASPAPSTPAPAQLHEVPVKAEASAAAVSGVPAPAPAEPAPARPPAAPTRTTTVAAIVCSVAAISLEDPRELETLARLVRTWRSDGLETVLAARGGRASLEPLLARLGFAGPLILDLGASLRSGPEERLLRATPLAPAIATAVLERLAETGRVRVALHDAEGPVDPQRVRQATLVRLDVSGDAEGLETAIAAISEPWWRDGAIAVFRIASGQASIVAGGVDKAVGLQRILRGLGLPPSRAFVIAGGDEDLGLLSLCRGIAVGSPSPRLASAATSVVPSGAWDAVDGVVRRALSAFLPEGTASVHSTPSDSAS